MSNLVIFDIDGTLINSTEVDAVCYLGSLKRFGINEIEARWQNYTTATDRGIFEEIFEDRFMRKPTAEELERQREGFLLLLKEHFAREPEAFLEIPGARRILAELRRRDDWRIGIATGGWRETALFKLSAAGININGIPLVSSSEKKKRDDIVRTCIERAREHYGVTAFEAIVSVGDAIWDVQVARKLDIGFIGIGGLISAELSGAPVFRDFLEEDRFIQSLYRAPVPPSPSSDMRPEPS